MVEEDEFWLEEGFISNVDEIIELAEQHKDKFVERKPGTEHDFSNNNGSSNMYALLNTSMSEELQAAIFKTIKPDYFEVPPDGYVINKYLPGCYLVRHRDMDGYPRYWKSELVFLKSDKPHLKVYNEKYPEGKLIEEKPGAIFHMPLTLEHEVTLIEENEQPKYSLIFVWLL